jgi:hypothetical protein
LPRSRRDWKPATPGHNEYRPRSGGRKCKRRDRGRSGTAGPEEHFSPAGFSSAQGRIVGVEHVHDEHHTDRRVERRRMCDRAPFLRSDKPIRKRWQPTATVSERMVRRGRQKVCYGRLSWDGKKRSQEDRFGGGVPPRFECVGRGFGPRSLALALSPQSPGDRLFSRRGPATLRPSPRSSVDRAAVSSTAVRSGRSESLS